ncbi:MAG: alpha/beta fold hydrolase [Bacteroidota bacterium]
MEKLLLLHGAIGSSKQFDPLLPLLKNHFDTYVLDYRGHGGKPIPEEKFTVPFFAEDVLSWMNENQIETINILGYSLGGYVALYLAKHHPERVGKVFTLSTKFHWNPEGAAKEAAMLNAEKIEEKVPAFAKVLVEKHGAANWKTVLSKTAEMMIAFGNEPALTSEDFAGLQHKVLVAVGDKDNMVTLEETIAMYRKLQNAQLLVLPQTPHPFEKMDMEQITFEINRFF